MWHRSSGKWSIVFCTPSNYAQKRAHIAEIADVIILISNWETRSCKTIPRLYDNWENNLRSLAAVCYFIVNYWLTLRIVKLSILNLRKNISISSPTRSRFTLITITLVFPRSSPLFCCKRSETMRQVRTVRATRERRCRVAVEKEFFRTFLSGFFFPERDGYNRMGYWKLYSRLSVKKDEARARRTSRRSWNGGGCKPCISFLPFNKGMRNDLGEAGRPKKVQ